MGGMELGGKEVKRSPVGADRSQDSSGVRSQTAESEKIRRDLTLEICLADFVGRSPKLVHVLEEIKVLAASDANVLISGETGTGKDMCARAIHYTGVRAAKPFVPVNCGSIPEDLWENQFFGHERGAYTDARERATGLLKEADGGTLFLDDIEALGLKNQVKLLRFLQTGSYMALGGVREVRANIRVIASTNEDLLSRMREHTFRGDLYFRLAVLLLHLSPLRERLDDVPLLANLFLKRFALQYHKPVNRISDVAMASLREYTWPGNVRELENIIHRAVVHATGSELTAVEIQPVLESGASVRLSSEEGVTFKQLKKQLVANFEKDYILHQLQSHRGNVSEAARRSGKNRRAFWELMRKYHITGRQPDGP
jgi:two-component system, NtrC family, response regulator GlrR